MALSVYVLALDCALAAAPAASKLDPSELIEAYASPVGCVGSVCRTYPGAAGAGSHTVLTPSEAARSPLAAGAGNGAGATTRTFAILCGVAVSGISQVSVYGGSS